LFLYTPIPAVDKPCAATYKHLPHYQHSALHKKMLNSAIILSTYKKTILRAKFVGGFLMQ